MRISDWSSDVCSSDLTGSIDRGEARGIGKGLQGICDGIFPCRGARGRQLVLGYDFGTSIESDCSTDRDLRASSCEGRSEEHTSELQSLMRISYAVFCLKKKNKHKQTMYEHKPEKGL